MRYADVLLMKAEAINESLKEPNSEAYDAVNQVRRRAYGFDVYTPNPVCDLPENLSREDFRQAVRDERFRELCFEGQRKWDLIRFNLMDEKISSLSEDMVVEKLVEDTESPDYIDPDYLKFQSDGYLKLGIPTIKQNWQPHKIWLPISEEQIGVNKSLTQNAGW